MKVRAVTVSREDSNGKKTEVPLPKKLTPTRAAVGGTLPLGDYGDASGSSSSSD